MRNRKRKGSPEELHIGAFKTTKTDDGYEQTAIFEGVRKYIDDRMQVCFGVSETFDKILEEYNGIDVVRTSHQYIGAYETVITKPANRDNRIDDSFKRVLFCRSHMGSGKTRAFNRYVHNRSSALILSTRVTYTNDIVSKYTQFINYRDIPRETPITYLDHPKLVLQYQSLRRILDISTTEKNAHWSVVFLDELDAIFKEMVCTGTMDAYQRTKNLAYFIKVISNANIIIACDANLTNWHIDLMMQCLTGVKIGMARILVNDYPRSITCNAKLIELKNASTISASCMGTFYNVFRNTKTNDDEKSAFKAVLSADVLIANARKLGSRQEFIFLNRLAAVFTKCYSGDLGAHDENLLSNDGGYSLFVDIVQLNKRCSAVCSTKRTAKMIYALFTQHLGRTDEEIILVTGDSSTYVKNTFMNKIASCKLLIYTSCLKVGVDISDTKFDKVYTFIDRRNPVLVSDMVQMIGRVRHSDEIVVCWSSTKSTGFDGVDSSTGEQLICYKRVQYPEKQELASKVIKHIKSFVGIEREMNASGVVFVNCLLKRLTINIEVDILVNGVLHRDAKGAVDAVCAIEPDIFGEVIQRISGKEASIEAIDVKNAISTHMINVTNMCTGGDSYEIYTRPDVDENMNTSAKEIRFFNFLSSYYTIKGFVSVMCEFEPNRLVKICNERRKRVLDIDLFSEYRDKKADILDTYEKCVNFTIKKIKSLSSRATELSFTNFHDFVKGLKHYMNYEDRSTCLDDGLIKSLYTNMVDAEEEDDIVSMKRAIECLCPTKCLDLKWFDIEKFIYCQCTHDVYYD